MRRRRRENNKITEEGIIKLTQNIKIVVERINKNEGKYLNCGGGNSRMKNENNKIVEEGIKKLRRETW